MLSAWGRSGFEGDQGATTYPEVLVTSQVDRRSTRQHGAPVGPRAGEARRRMDGNLAPRREAEVEAIRTPTDDGGIVGVGARPAAGLGESVCRDQSGE